MELNEFFSTICIRKAQLNTIHKLMKSKTTHEINATLHNLSELTCVPGLYVIVFSFFPIIEGESAHQEGRRRGRKEKVKLASLPGIPSSPSEMLDKKHG